MNKITILGRFTRDPELSTTTTGIETCRFSLAVDRRPNKQTGEKVADFFPCVAYRASAAFVAKYMHTGDELLVTGRMESYKYTKDGQEKTGWSLVCEEVYATHGSKKSGSNAPASAPAEPVDAQSGMTDVTAAVQEDLPF